MVFVCLYLRIGRSTFNATSDITDSDLKLPPMLCLLVFIEVKSRAIAKGIYVGHRHRVLNGWHRYLFIHLGVCFVVSLKVSSLI